MASKYRKILPLEDRHDELYGPPTPEVYEAGRKERNTRTQLGEDLSGKKKGVVKKLNRESTGMKMIRVVRQG